MSHWRMSETIKIFIDTLKLHYISFTAWDKSNNVGHYLSIYFITSVSLHLAKKTSSSYHDMKRMLALHFVRTWVTFNAFLWPYSDFIRTEIYEHCTAWHVHVKNIIFILRAKRTTCARQSTLDWIGLMKPYTASHTDNSSCMSSDGSSHRPRDLHNDERRLSAKTPSFSCVAPTTRRPCCRREPPRDARHLYRKLAPDSRATQGT